MLYRDIVGKGNSEMQKNRQKSDSWYLFFFFMDFVFNEAMGWTKGKAIVIFIGMCCYFYLPVDVCLWKKEWKNTGVMSSVLKS